MEKLMEYLTQAAEGHATDLFIVAGGPICARQDRKVVPLSTDRVFPRDTEALMETALSASAADRLRGKTGGAT